MIDDRIAWFHYNGNGGGGGVEVRSGGGILKYALLGFL